MKKLFFTAMMMIGLVASGTAFALDLDGARASGAVGEKLDGYVSVIKPSAEAQALADDINARRKAEYQKISGQNKQPLDVVGKVAAEKIIGGLPSGAYYQGAGGGWKQK